MNGVDAPPKRTLDEFKEEFPLTNYTMPGGRGIEIEKNRSKIWNKTDNRIDGLSFHVEGQTSRGEEIVVSAYDGYTWKHHTAFCKGNKKLFSNHLQVATL